MSKYLADCSYSGSIRIQSDHRLLTEFSIKHESLKVAFNIIQQRMNIKENAELKKVRDEQRHILTATSESLLICLQINSSFDYPQS